MTRRATLMLSLAIPLLLVVPRTAIAGTESDFVSRTNSARASHGLGAYAVRSDLLSVARRQAVRMASAHQIYHNPNLGSDVSNWRALGENVGRGPTVSSIQTAFMSSPEHRANILSSTYTEVGIGTATGSDGQIYVSAVFRLPMRATYVAPAPRRTYRGTTTRASRSAPRLHPAVKPALKARVIPADPLPGRIATAWRMYRRARPVDPFDRAQVYLRTSRFLVV